MHIFFSGIGGTGIGPLAVIAKQAGYEVSGSDKQTSQYIDYLKKLDIENIHIGQDSQQIAKLQAAKPIDWFVYSSALPIENPEHPELKFCQANGIKTSKREELLNKIIAEHDLKLIAIAGTHGKTTTTAMAIWLFKQMNQLLSYSVGAKISFGDMGHFDSTSKYFVLEADEFDKNFLAFKPELSLITGVGYDHHEIYPTEEVYKNAFKQFIDQSKNTVIWSKDAKKLDLLSNATTELLEENDQAITKINLTGLYNRRDAWLVISGLGSIMDWNKGTMLQAINNFPGVSRRFEKVAENLYSDYAHTPEKIIASMNVAKETANGRKIIVVYEPLTNRRMHYTAAQHRDVFAGAGKLYWIPSYLVREDQTQKVLKPAELIKNLNPKLQTRALPAELNEELKTAITGHLKNGDLVLAMSGGSGGSLDEWLRQQFS